jgi:hypothetical protein
MKDGESDSFSWRGFHVLSPFSDVKTLEPMHGTEATTSCQDFS